jgi:hypothetical protein
VAADGSLTRCHSATTQCKSERTSAFRLDFSQAW